MVIKKGLSGPLRLSQASEPTVLGEFGGTDQGGDGEAVSGTDRQASPAPRHAAGAAAQQHALMRVAVVIPGGGQRQVAAHVLHAFAVTLGRSRQGRVISRPVMSECQQRSRSAAQMLHQDGDYMLFCFHFSFKVRPCS